MRKKIIPIMLFAVALMLTGCKADHSTSIPEPSFPLEESTVIEALDKLSFDWVISENETLIISEENREAVLYQLRDPEKKLNEESENTILYAGIFSGIDDGKRRLCVTFTSVTLGLDGKPFAWEDWKDQIILSAILYGGFKDTEEVYAALFRTDAPAGDEAFQCSVKFQNSYCVVKRSPVQHKPSPGRYVLWIDFYESEGHYHETLRKINQAGKEAVKRN